MSRRVADYETRLLTSKTFRQTDAEDEAPHYLYRLFTADGQLLYIGVAFNVEQRVYMHRATRVCSGWDVIWREYDHHTSERYATKSEARAAERAAITREAPLLNRQHNPKRWRRVHGQYLPVDGLDDASEAS